MIRRLGVLTFVVALAAAAYVGGAMAPPREAVSAGVKPDIKLGQKTGYFNMPRVMRDYRRFNEAAVRLKARNERGSANLVALRAMYLELQAKAQIATPDQKDRIAREMITLVRAIEDLDRELTKMLNERASEIITILYREIRETVAELAREQGFTAIHGYPGNPSTEVPAEMEMMLKPMAAQPYYIDPSAEVTDELIRRLNIKVDAAGQ